MARKRHEEENIEEKNTGESEIESWENEDRGGGNKVNLNTASKEELMQIEGLDEESAGRIIQYREENGGFGSIDEVTQIPGFGETLLEKVKAEATV